MILVLSSLPRTRTAPRITLPWTSTTLSAGLALHVIVPLLDVLVEIKFLVATNAKELVDGINILAVQVMPDSGMCFQFLGDLKMRLSKAGM